MDILEECKDSNLLEDTFLTAQYRTDTYYPPGQALFVRSMNTLDTILF